MSARCTTGSRRRWHVSLLSLERMARAVFPLLLSAACSRGDVVPVRPDGGAIVPLVCAPPQSICESQCVDTASDPLHCGGCNQPCGGGTECVNGACVCPASTTLCNGVCVDLMSDAGNCMRCGNTCLDGRICDFGLCICPPSFSECSGRCVDLASDHDACGDCETSCSPLQSCVERACGCGDLSACPGGTTGYCSRDLERYCCQSGEIFCDVDDTIAFPGGCIPGGLDCGNLFSCGGDFVSCAADREANCSTTGVAACCAADRPVFCDAVGGIGYDGGCWEPNVDCATISVCGPVIFACYAGGRPFCTATESYVCCQANEVFCEANPGIGYDGGCWPQTIDCASITDCGGGNYTACPQGTGRPNCTTNVCE